MAKRTMPQAKAERPAEVNLHWDLSPKVLDRWMPQMVAAAAADDATISIYDQIGYDPWTGDGVTANRISAALRLIGASKDVTVNINSPGGDMFEGLAIYNLFRQHKGQVTMRVIGLAASAASVIAMAGDEIQVARAGFFMIHCCWLMAMGNRNDLRDVADTLEPFDKAMADVYAARVGMTPEEALQMMDEETWIGGQAAVDQGFADALLEADQVTEQARSESRVAAWTIDRVLAKAGMSRTERRAMMQEFKAGKRSAAGTDGDTQTAVPDPQEATQNAGAETLKVLQAFSLDQSFRSLHNAIAGAKL